MSYLNLFGESPLSILSPFGSGGLTIASSRDGDIAQTWLMSVLLVLGHRVGHKVQGEPIRLNG